MISDEILKRHEDLQETNIRKLKTVETQVNQLAGQVMKLNAGMSKSVDSL